jgi:NADPH:quinone reductase
MVRAARLKQHGEPLEIEPVEPPQPSDGEVLVQLAFGGVNPVDRYVAEGRVAPDGPLPRTLGGEASGWLNGLPVLVFGDGLGAARDGVWAEAAVVPMTAVFELPDGVDLRDAAAMGVAGLTAWNVVHGVAHVTGEDRVLVLGASGGVGSMIVSLAAAAGATVWGQTGSEDKASLVREQGAEVAVVAGPDQLADALSDYQPTVVFDPLGDGFVAPAISAITPRGRYVAFGTSAGAEVTFNLQTLYRKAVALLGYGGLQLRQDERRLGLERALAALRDGELRVHIDEALPLEQVNEAFARITQRRVQGKLLLQLDPTRT